MNADFLSEQPEPAPAVVTVSALNQSVARLLERSFPLLWVSGEVSNFTRAASGHWYFSLKDASAQVRAVMFRGRAQYADFLPREGDKVEVRTLVTLYPARGDFQLSVEAIRRAGIGNLFEAFVRLKQKLQAEGLFDAARKRPIPPLPRRIGIVTSLQAAALRDVLAALRRRAPHIDVVIYPAPVQGEGAAQRLANALRTAAQRAECDVLLLCRGGGGIEDLWAFNDEMLARTIASCAIPVICGVGHETDFTIADFAADLRAATPTAAAELAAPAHSALVAHLRQQANDLRRAMRRQLEQQQHELDWQARRLRSPAATIAQQQFRLAALHSRLQHALRLPLTEARHQLGQWRHRLNGVLPSSASGRQQLRETQRRLASAMARRSGSARHQLAQRVGQLDLLDPQRTLERGYAIVSNADGIILRSPDQLRAAAVLQVRLAQGSATVAVAGTKPGAID